jgi:hypothetical protein
MESNLLRSFQNFENTLHTFEGEFRCPTGAMFRLGSSPAIPGEYQALGFHH